MDKTEAVRRGGILFEERGLGFNCVTHRRVGVPPGAGNEGFEDLIGKGNLRYEIGRNTLCKGTEKIYVPTEPGKTFLWEGFAVEDGGRL